MGSALKFTDNGNGSHDFEGVLELKLYDDVDWTYKLNVKGALVDTPNEPPYLDDLQIPSGTVSGHTPIEGYFKDSPMVMGELHEEIREDSPTYRRIEAEIVKEYQAGKQRPTEASMDNSFTRTAYDKFWIIVDGVPTGNPENDNLPYTLDELREMPNAYQLEIAPAGEKTLMTGTLGNFDTGVPQYAPQPAMAAAPAALKSLVQRIAKFYGGFVKDKPKNPKLFTN